MSKVSMQANAELFSMIMVYFIVFIVQFERVSFQGVTADPGMLGGNIC